MAHNHVSIDSDGIGNTFNINQNQVYTPPHIEYANAESSVERLSRMHVNKGAMAYFGSGFLALLAIVADSLGVLSFLGIQTGVTIAFVIPSALVVMFLTNRRRKIATTAFEPGKATFIDGKWTEQEPDGNYVQYCKTAQCIYPKCTGTVFIHPAPPRVRPNHVLVGVCCIGGRRHTYTVDFNGIGFPEQFDWRPVEERKL